MTGTWPLVRLALRRDRVLLPAWVIGFAAMVTASVAATRDLYPTEASLTSAAETINATAALVALYGTVYDPTSLGAVSLIKLTAFGSALVGILFAFVMVRHTRSDEETERLELVSAGVVGRAAPLTAAFIVTMGASVFLGMLCTVGLGGVGLPWGGAVAFGLAWTLSGIVFAGVAAVAAQVMTSARGAIGVAIAAVGAGYVLRAVGDLAEGDPGLLSWLSPIGWSQQMRPFAGDRWWVAVLPLTATALLIAGAFVLRGHRDLGAGLIAERPGPARGRLGGVTALAWRLQRGMLVAWLTGATLMGAVLGSVAQSVAGLLDSPEMAKYLEALGGRQGVTDAFLAAVVGVLGSIVAAYGLAAAARLRAEEANGHAEVLLATPASRLAWAASHLTVALVGVAVVVVASGAAAGLTHGLSVGDVTGQVPRLVGASAAQIPAAWVMVGVVVLLFGLVPRWVGGAWGVFAAFIVLGEFGPLWGLPRWVLDLSPFAHSPRLPSPAAAADNAWQLVLLLVVVVVLLAAGLVGWRRRDLQP